MALDPNISSRLRPLEVPDPLAQMAQVSQIQSGQQQQQLNKMKIEELIADRKELNDFALKLQDKGITPRQYMEMLRSSRDPAKQKTGVEGLMRLDEQDKFERYGRELYPDLFGATAPPAPVPAAPVPAAPVPAAPVNALAPNAAPTAAPVNALAAPAGKTEDQLRREIMLFSQSGDPRAKAMVDMLNTQLTNLSKPAPDAALMKQLGYPLTQAGYQSFRDAQRQDRILTPAEEAQRIRIASASRPPAQPRPEPTPTITSIVNPVNPNEMITIDARRYQGGGAGSPGVIGVAGKEPGAALRQSKVEAGKTQLADDLDNLRASFEALDKMRSIPSTERNALSNVASGIAATGIGQKTGQLFGTEAQVERDVINSARTRLVNSIKNATGMSAQQLNSNVELQTMLKSISDPGQSVQAAMRIIGDIEDAYVKGDGKMLKRGAPAAAANVVVTPDGQSHTFPTPAAAAAFKKAAGL